MKPLLTPLRLAPAFKDYLWGGRRLADFFPIHPPTGPIAEAWIVSTRPEGMSRIENGPFAGRGLAEAIAAWGVDLLGTRAPSGTLPLLIKLIDARDRLSVQVHPDDEASARGLGEAKTEMWVVLEATSDARIHAGFVPGRSRAEIEKALRDLRFADVIRSFAVRENDAVLIPGGRIHAIDAGCLILEIQQNSNTTFRLHDWGRVDANGKPRETHWDRALSVIRWDDTGDPRIRPEPVPAPAGVSVEQLRAGPYFQVERIRADREIPLPSDGSSFQALFTASGSIRLRWNGGEMDADRGSTLLMPAARTDAVAVPNKCPTVLYRIRLP